MLSKALELGLLWGHVVGLQTCNQLSDFDVGQTVSIGTETGFVVGFGKIGTIDGLKSTDHSTKVVQSEVQWGRAVVVELGCALGCKDDRQ